MSAIKGDKGRAMSAKGVIASLLALVLIACAVPVSASAPGAPVMVTAWASGTGRATIIFNPPASDGGSSITSYTVKASPDGLTAAGGASPIIISDLTFGTHYTFTATATNNDNTGDPSGVSNIVIARPFAPATGTINNIVVFIRFSDQPAYTQPLSFYEGQFNTASNSLKNFYFENSYGTLTVNSFLYPLSSESVSSYQDQNPTAYYLPYSASNTIGYQGSEGTARETALVQHALDYISAQIPGGLELDGDHDGYVDHITFQVYSTADHPLPGMFYSRATFDTSGSITLKDIPVGSYTWVTASQDDPGMYPGATAIHEMGHSFGYPDLRNNGSRNPVGNYDVMSLAIPVHSGAYMKHRFTNWIPDIPEITSYGTYTIYSINDIIHSDNNSYKIKLPNTANEFLILEYRKATGLFESNLPGSGLCITRVNESAGIWGNLGGPPFFLYYFRTDGTISSDGAGANFTCLNEESGRTQFNDYSNPACFRSDGSACGISIYDIGSAAVSSITFSVGDPNTTVVTHLISGYLYNGGNRLSGATVTLSGDAAGTATTDSLGRYQFTVNARGSYTVTPSKANLTFTPVVRTFNDVTSDQTQNFSAANNTNTISGTITSDGAPLSGVTVSCSTGYCPPPVTTGETGKYSFTVNAGGDYDISPGKTNYFFSPYKISYKNITADQVQDFTTHTASLTLSGTITYNGSALSGISVSCPNANVTPITTDVAGNYSFTVTVGNGSAYTVAPSSSQYVFSPVNRFYTGLVSSQPGQNFSAVLNPGGCANRNAKNADTSVYYDTVQSGYSAAGGGNTVMLHAVSFIEDLLLDNINAMVLTGGYDCDYGTNAGSYTAIRGKMTISGGRVTLENLILK